jgi:organic hydroperoxide reductase OsmC/OhrA
MSLDEHRYALTVRWTGNLGEGTASYRGYSRDHDIEIPGLPVLRGSADPTFHGDRNRYNPEQLLLAALSQCHMLSFLHVAMKHGVVVTAYEDRAEGLMRTNRDGSGQFESVMLKPRVTLASQWRRKSWRNCTPGRTAFASSRGASTSRCCTSRTRWSTAKRTEGAGRPGLAVQPGCPPPDARRATPRR